MEDEEGMKRAAKTELKPEEQKQEVGDSAMRVYG